MIGVQRVFPYSRVVDRATAGLAGAYDVRVDDLSRGLLPGDFTLRGVHLTTRSGQPHRFTFDRIDVDLDVVALISGRIESRVDARGQSGRLRGRVAEGKGGLELDVVATELPLHVVAGGNRLQGEPRIRLRLIAPGGALSAASGEVEATCEACTVASRPPVRLGHVSARAAVSGGVACIAQTPESAADGALRIAGGLRLADDLVGTEADLVAELDAAAEHVVYTARGRIGELVWAQGAASGDECARLRRPELGRPGLPVAALAPRPGLAADPRGDLEEPSLDPEPILDPEASPAIPPQPLEPELPLDATPPAARPDDRSAELGLEY